MRDELLGSTTTTVAAMRGECVVASSIWSRLVAGVAAVCCTALLSACLADRSLPANVGSRTACSTSRDCPADFVCPAVAGDAKASCLPRNAPACGNGVLDKGEACDDGNLISGDGCRSNCTLEKCGDGILDANEKCDDGNNVSGDGCSADCKKIEICGDGVVDVGEDCDDGAANADTAACTSHCKTARCGDGFVHTGVEACDDGNTLSGDGCSGDCHKVERCGDGVVDVGEACDDGAVNGVAGEGACYADCSKRVVCGDGVVDTAGGEVCDDGNTLSGDNCRGDCRKVERCGDGVVDANEACDDGNANDNDGCDSTCHLTQWAVTVVTGLGRGGGDPLTTETSDPLVAVDRIGRVFVADGVGRVFRIDGAGTPSARAVVVAGTGVAAFSADGGPAVGAAIDVPRGFSIDAAGRMFLATIGDGRIRRVDADGTIHTIAGTGTNGFSGDGGPAIAAQLDDPFDAAVDSRGQVFIADLGNCALRRIDAAGVISTIRGGVCGAPGAFLQLLDLDVDGQDRVILAEGVDRLVERFDGTTFTTVAGGGTNPPAEGADPLTVRFELIRGVAAVGTDVFFTDGKLNQVYRVDASGRLHIVAGTGATGFAGDGGDATQAQLNFPSRIAAFVDPTTATTTIYETEIGNKDTRVVDASGVINTIMGAPPHVDLDAISPVAVARDSAGRIVWCDGNGFVARVEASGALTVVGGSGVFADVGDGAAALAGGFRNLAAIAIDSASGRVALAEPGVVRSIEPDGTLATLGGISNNRGFTPDGAPAVGSRMSPSAVAVDAQGRIVFYDDGGDVVRRIEDDGTLLTIAGDPGNAGAFVDGDASSAGFGDNVGSLAVDAVGDVYVADQDNKRVRKIDLGAVPPQVSTFAGDGAAGFDASEEGALATSAGIGGVTTIAFDDQGRLLLGSGDVARVLRVDVDRTIHTIFGDGGAREDGDGGPASLAHVAAVGSIVSLGGDDFAFVSSIGTIRREQGGLVTTVAGIPAAPQGVLASPQSFAAIDASTILLASGTFGVVERFELAADVADFVVAPGVNGFPIGADPLPLSTPDGPESRAQFAAGFQDACGIAWDDAASFAYIADRGAGIIARLRVPVATRGDASTWTVAIAAGAAGDRRHVDGADRATTRLVGPCGLALSGDGATLFVADVDDDTVRSVDLSSGASSTLFGVSGAPGNLDDLLSGPTAVALDAGEGALFIADTDNHRVRRLDLSAHTVSDVIGTGEAASSGDGAPATAFPVQSPRGLAFDSFGDLIVTSTRTVRLVTANAAGVVDGSGAVVTLYGAVPRDSFPQDSTFCLSGLEVVADDEIRVVDGCQGYLLDLRRTAREPVGP